MGNLSYNFSGYFLQFSYKKPTAQRWALFFIVALQQNYSANDFVKGGEEICIYLAVVGFVQDFVTCIGIEFDADVLDTKVFVLVVKGGHQLAVATNGVFVP